MSDSSSTTWDLPRDLFSDILERGSTKTVARCSAVSRTWKFFVASTPDLEKRLVRKKLFRRGSLEPRLLRKLPVSWLTSSSVDLKGSGCMCLPAESGKGVLVCDLADSPDRGGFPRRVALHVDAVIALAFVDECLLIGDTRGHVHGHDVREDRVLFDFHANPGKEESGYHTFAFMDFQDFLVIHTRVPGQRPYLVKWRKHPWAFDTEIFFNFITSIQARREEKVLIVASIDIQVWDMESCTCLRVITTGTGGHLPGAMASFRDEVVFTRGNDVILASWRSGKELKTLRNVWKLSTLARIFSLGVNGDKVFCCLNVGGFQTQVIVWDREDWLSCRLNTGVKCESVFVKGEKVVAVTAHGNVLEWDFEAGSQ